MYIYYHIHFIKYLQFCINPQYSLTILSQLTQKYLTKGDKNRNG